MLLSFQDVIKDYVTPPNSKLTLDMDVKFKVYIQYLKDCRPLSIGMGNAVKSFKKSIGLTRLMKDKEAKEFLLDEINKFIENKITLADKLIKRLGITKICDGDVILTYGHSHVVENIFIKAKKKRNKF